jgi:methylphosphotriester-DNA--protein-cysteine methyltransferase
VREADLARELNIDPAHLGRCLRTQTGLGFRDWYLAVTLRAVLPPLICTDQPLKSIAEDPALGALGTRQLTRSIVKTFGLSPGALRRRARTLGVDKVVVSTDSSAQVLS